jgi:hypothetical protein
MHWHTGDIDARIDPQIQIIVLQLLHSCGTTNRQDEPLSEQRGGFNRSTQSFAGIVTPLIWPAGGIPLP